MKIQLFNLGAVMLAAIMVFPSCSKDDTTGSGKLSYKVKPSNFTASVASNASASGLVVNINSNSSLTWTTGNANISEIDFEAEKNDVEIEREYKNLVNVDLFNLSPVLGTVSLPDGTYDEVELKLELKQTTTQAIPLTLKGTYTNASGIKAPVEFYFNENFEVEVEAEDLVVNGSTDYLALINVQLNKFLTNVSTSDMDSATKTNGTIVISSASNLNLYNKLKANLNAFGDCDFED